MRRENEFLYVRLYQTLKEQIVSGLIKPGDYLLPENELCRHYKMSRNSVRKALEQLQNDGLVVKRAGLGTMVPADLAIAKSDRHALRILAPYPAHFVDNGLPVIIEAFNKEYPHVEVKLLSLPAVKFWESFQLSGEMGLSADLVLVSDMQLADMDSLAAFADLKPSLEECLAAIYPKILNRFRHAGEIKAAPITFTPLYLAFNPQLFAKNNVPQPAQDWKLDDFLDAAEKLTEVRNGLTVRYGFSVFPNISRWPVFALQNERTSAGRDTGGNAGHAGAAGEFGRFSDSGPVADVLREGGMCEPSPSKGGLSKRSPRKGGLSQSSLHKALTLLEDLLFRRRIAAVYPDAAANPFLHEKSAMVLTTTFEMSGWKDRNIGFVPQVASLPFGPAKATLLQANALMIPAGASDPALSRAFIRIALETRVQEAMCVKTPFLSVMRQVNEATRPKPYLQALNIDGSLVDNNFFLHELFSDAAIDELADELGLFWLGLESAASVAKACEASARR